MQKDRFIESPITEEQVIKPPRLSVHVYQATGMVAVQADCDVTEALNRLTIRATATGQSLEDIALDVLDRVVRFNN